MARSAPTSPTPELTPEPTPEPRPGRPTGRLPGPLLVVLAAVCWGTGGLAGSVLGAQSGLSPVAVGAYRLAVAAVVLVGLAVVAGGAGRLLATVRGLAVGRGDALRVTGVGVGLALFQICYFLAVRAIGVSVATLLTLGLAPVLVTLGGALLLRERVGVRLRVSLPLALVGLGLLVGTADGSSGEGSTVAGAVMACTSAMGYAAVTLLGRSLAGRVDPAHVTTLGFAVGALVALPVGLAMGMGFPPSAGSLALVLYLGVVPTALAYALFFAGLRSTASGTASVLTLAEPLTATVLAVLLLGERLVVVQWLGAALLCAAVVVLSTSAGRLRPRSARAP